MKMVTRRMWSIGVFLGALTATVWAGERFTLSRQADFSTDDRLFTREDTLFVLIEAPEIDFADIHKSEFRLKPDHGGPELRGHFTNRLDGTYTAAVPLAGLASQEVQWEWRGRLQDDRDRKFEARVDLLILGGAFGGQRDEVKFTGVIVAIEDTTVFVDGVPFDVTPMTELRGDHGHDLLLADLTAGLTVEVRAVIGQDGRLKATRIKVEDRKPKSGFQTRGVITEIGEDHLTVGDLTFVVNAQTEIRGADDRDLALADLQVGQEVEVHAQVLEDGTLLATKIEVKDEVEDELEITGPIESLGDHTLTVGGRTIAVTDSTEILDDDGNPMAFTALQIGQVVEVRIEVADDGTLLAVRIKVEERNENKLKLTGTIESVGADNLVVAGITFFVDANTEIKADDRPITLADLAPGQVVEVRARRQPDGSWLATKIEREDRIEDEVKVRGAIDAITETTITVLGRTFVLTENTVVQGRGGTQSDRSALTVGTVVEVRGELLGDGTLVAIRIKIEDRDVHEIEVEGVVEAKGADTIQVLGISFLVTASTEILDVDKRVLPFDQLTAGQTVEVRALRLSDGVNEALRIKVEDVALLAGMLSRVTGDSLEVAGRKVILEADALVLGVANEVRSRTALAGGQFVQVRTIHDQTGVVATKVTLEAEATVTSVAGEAGEANPPRVFSLLQNYPNPFNPSTTIRFNLKRAARLRLEVYNLLGQRVRTLLAEQTVAAGGHTVQWDGRDDRGKPVPSGVYLYRLASKSFSETRTMALLK